MWHRLSFAAALIRSAWLYLLALGGLALLGYLFGVTSRAARLEQPNNLDREAIAWVVEHRDEWGAATAFFRAITRFGDSEFSVPATLAVAVALFALPRLGRLRFARSEWAIWVAMLLGSWFVGRWLKTVFERERPPLLHRLVREESFSFPSGHSVFAAAFFTALAFLLVQQIPRSRPGLRALAVVACLASALLVAASRVWLAVHYPTDVLGGLLLGFGWVASARSIRIAWRHWRGGPSPSA